MKKVFYIIAVSAFAFFSCQRQELDPTSNTNEAKNDSFTFKASIEQLATKANIDDSNALVWATGDQIGIYVNDENWTDKNQPFSVSNGVGSSQAEFTWDNSGTFSDKAAAAFFPWEGTGSDKNNVYEGTMYFKLRDAYWSYESGKMLTPLIAPLNGSTDEIHFKHAGAAVKVTINNLPARVHSIGMSVAGQQISGDFSINPANAGTDALAVVGTADATKNTVWLNVWNGSESAWSFIFPVPELTKPKLSFQIWDENDVLVWEKKLKAQPSDLGRGDILVMPPIDITPYSQFKESTEWTFCGTIGGVDAWNADIPMYTDGTVCILAGVNFAAGDEFKIRKDKAWDVAYPSSNYVVNEAGKKDVWFTPSTGAIELKDAKCPYPAPKVTLYFGINGAIPKSIHISSSTLAPGADWPGLELTEKEYINGKWYYKHVVDGTTVWGKSISGVYIVSKDSWNTTGSTITFSTIKTEYYFEATASTAIEQLSARPADAVATGITIDGDMSDWNSILPLESNNGGTGRIRSWKYSSKDDTYFFYFVLRKNRMSTANTLSIGFDYTDGGAKVDNLSGYDTYVKIQPFTNASEGTPSCVNGTISTANINGTEQSGLTIKAYGLDPDASATGDSADYYLEVSIPRSILTGLPTNGAIVKIGAGCNGYNTGFQSVTL